MSVNKKLVATYSKSLFQNVLNLQIEKFGKPLILDVNSKDFIPTIDIIGEELILLRSSIESSKILKNFFNNPTYAELKKLEILQDIFPGLTLKTIAFLKILTEKGHLSYIPEISKEYTKLISKYKNIIQVKIITASILPKKAGKLLLNKLKAITGSDDIILKVSYNPKLLGGLIIEYGSSSIDASILKEFSLFFNDI
jgi:F-type H+-transporting ATPase subunit delta